MAPLRTVTGKGEGLLEWLLDVADGGEEPTGDGSDEREQTGETDES